MTTPSGEGEVILQLVAGRPPAAPCRSPRPCESTGTRRPAQRSRIPGGYVAIEPPNSSRLARAPYWRASDRTAAHGQFTALSWASQRMRGAVVPM